MEERSLLLPPRLVSRLNFDPKISLPILDLSNKQTQSFFDLCRGEAFGRQFMFKVLDFISKCFTLPRISEYALRNNFLFGDVYCCRGFPSRATVYESEPRLTYPTAKALFAKICVDIGCLRVRAKHLDISTSVEIQR